MAWSLMSKTPHLNLVTRPDQHESVNPDVPQELSIRAPHEHCAQHSGADALTKLGDLDTGV